MHNNDHAAHHPALQHQFNSMDQQRDSAQLGMWVFLVTEIMFFGGLFTAYIIYRGAYSTAFADASNDLDITLGAINTAVLIGSSFTMAMAVYFSQTGKRTSLISFLVLTIILGSVFLVIKGFEYHHKFVLHHVPGPNFFYPGPEGNHVQLFFSLYFAMTGLHAFHMIIGLGLLITLIVQAMKGKFSVEYNSPVELTGLYWHFVDIVWIFLFPLLYLIGRHAHHH